jgi:glutamate N-acetyltransferase/amino-acid N-acetyltransferase
VACGLKDGEALDLGLLVCDAGEATSAARFTASGVLAAPVVLMQQRCDLAALRAVVANSGNANAATGGRGRDNATKVQGAGAMVAGVDARQVAVASTGVIGVQLDADAIVRGLMGARSALGPEGDVPFGDAIRTTDAFPKRASLAVELSSGTVRLSAQAKGAGMISPSFATMLCFVQTDAALTAETCDLLLGAAVKWSFDRISVDGQLSTNDTAILMASGVSGVAVEPETPDEFRLAEALAALLRQLAVLIARDGEGAGRVGRIVVRGGDQAGVERTARAIANSPLVKTALHGADPNWGRIAQSIGLANPGSAPLFFDIAIEGVPVARGGAAVPYDAAALNDAVTADEVDYDVTLPGEGAETEVIFSDFGHEYVRINAEYTT